ncbi:hypothetical protein CONCODRAFT_79730 [Conidiobolus coronatus NRRL 28638]|uniref:Transmembrane protein n=1 Tax=Conidiobolus coronatus (strain ATCC 28846 / CBS 209.66 / NRRL 28638) TaxID=796925 RepID=A0A137P073_CONC2|nr:hypothetical protein CONCODRAFT_79730 [Conidiobolus coronatus NRRL 28638]|eukprot:KXN68490.1 hypothetical protein CONCODRAFT_79730 [Conidiobolus coronatus NRRL 28638]
MKINSIIALTFVSQCLSENAVDICVRERKCTNLDLSCLFGCLNDTNTKPNNSSERFECTVECPKNGFTQCEKICYSDSYKKSSSSRISIASPLLTAAFSLSVFYLLV